IRINNTTVVGGSNGLTQVDIHSFGAATTPGTTASFVIPGAVFDGVSAGQGPSQNFPGGVSQINVFIFGSNNCAGGASFTGLAAGSHDAMTLALSGDFGTTPHATLAFFPIKFQTNRGSFEAGGRTRAGPPEQVPEVPLPATLPLLAAGLIAL